MFVNQLADVINLQTLESGVAGEDSVHLQIGGWRSPTDLCFQDGAAGQHFSSGSSPSSTSLHVLPLSPAPMQPLKAPGTSLHVVVVVFVIVVVIIVIVDVVHLLACLATLTSTSLHVVDVVDIQRPYLFPDQSGECDRFAPISGDLFRCFGPLFLFLSLSLG